MAKPLICIARVTAHSPQELCISVWRRGAHQAGRPEFQVLHHIHCPRKCAPNNGGKQGCAQHSWNKAILEACVASKHRTLLLHLG